MPVYTEGPRIVVHDAFFPLIVQQTAKRVAD
jgi:hypothetical protein